MKEFNSLIDKFSKDEKKMETYYAPRITQIIDNYLGKGKKVNEMNRDQVEQLVLIIDDLKRRDLTINSIAKAATTK